VEVQAVLGRGRDGRQAAGTDVVRSMAELDGSHVIMISQPEAVTDVIKTAAAAVDRSTVAAGGGAM
jgi:hypothetical protein